MAAFVSCPIFNISASRVSVAHSKISTHDSLAAKTEKISNARVVSKKHSTFFAGSACRFSAAPSSSATFLNTRVNLCISAEAKVIDGKKISEDIRKELKEEVAEMVSKGYKVPGLAVVLVGERKDSATYVRSKKKGCEEIGIKSFGVDLPATATQDEVLKAVADLNANPDVHGILVQLPLPDHIDPEVVLSAIDLEKDVDGFHPINIGRLAMTGRSEPLSVACTPAGCIVLLERSGVEFKGKKAVVLGRSNVVGLPAANLLLKKDCTVTICHSKTADLAGTCREADILIAAVGRPEMVKGDWIKPGAAVIDVGINAKDDPSNARGYRLVGDVDYAEASKVAGLITPVPGGVGPMTIAMLLKNTVDLAKRAEKFDAARAPATV